MKVHTIKLDRISNTFDVRRKLNDDRVAQFSTMLDNLPPVTVVEIEPDDNGPRYAYVDGRHRGAAHALAGYTEIYAYIQTASDPLTIYSQALKANWGGAEPPSREDIAHTVTRLMEMKVSQKDIRDTFTFIPRRSMDLYITWAKGVLHKRRISAAIDAVADGLTVNEAAATYGLKVEVLSDAVSGKKRKWGAGRTDEQQAANEMKTYISRVLRSANGGIAKKMDEIMKQVEAGEMSSGTASSIVNSWKEHLRRTGLRCEDWLARIDAIGVERDKLVVK